MNNFEDISRALSQDNADISELKTKTKKLTTKTNSLDTSKEDSFIILNTDAFSGLTFNTGLSIDLEQNIILDLFNVRSKDILLSQFRDFDNKTFVLKPILNSFTVNSIEYMITSCTPCVGKITNYGDTPVLCLTFLIDTNNSQTALFQFFIFGFSDSEMIAKLSVKNISEFKTINGESVVGSGNIIISYPEVYHGFSDTTFTLTPNIFHVWNQVLSLTLDFGSEASGVANEYLFQFTSGSTATSLTLPISIKWANDSVPTIVGKKTYQVSVLNGLASILEFNNDMTIDVNNYLTVEALEDNLTVTFTKDIEYAIDGKEWIKLTAGNKTQPINTKHFLIFKGELTPKWMYGIGTFTISKKCNLKGNCMSILFGDNAINNFSLSGKSYAFYRLFENCTNIVNVDSNFLPATTLAESCYADMFMWCESLTTAPELPATTLEEHCYRSMFEGCTSLITTPELPATTLGFGCYSNMFQNCTSLVNAPELPATTLTYSCYSYMFYGCTSLTTAPELPATTLTHSCYSDMFRECTNLTTAPELPATTLAENCYYQMFDNCESLTTAPTLPATTLAIDCYNRMFFSCTKLNYIKMLATDISATNCLVDWVNGVSSTGTFVKSAAMTSLPTGYSGIPSGWTVSNI